MLDAVVSIAGFFLVFLGVVFVHELGHYYAGRRIAGIPASDIKIVMSSFPQYVALRDGNEWISPSEFERYQAVYERHDPEFEHVERYVAAGEIVQAAVVIPVGVVLALVGFEEIAASVLVISLLTTVFYVLVDAGTTLYSKTPSGDYSALWQVSPRVPITLLAGFVFTHLGAFYFVT